jgi:hypothetical protein
MTAPLHDRKRFAFALVAAISASAFGALGACSTTSDRSASSLDHGGDLCHHFCDRVHTCNGGSNVSLCVNDCESTNGKVLPKLRTDYVGAVEKCLDDTSCKVMGASVFQTCIQTAHDAMTPSAATTKYCDDVVAFQERCGNAPADPEACADEAKVFDDATLGQYGACLARECGAALGCQHAAF